MRSEGGGAFFFFAWKREGFFRERKEKPRGKKLTPFPLFLFSSPSSPPPLQPTNHPTDEGDNAGVSLRGLFIISPTGVLRQITVNDLPVGRSVDETLRLVKAFQFTDEHGEVCPAGWEPGAKTIKPDVAGSKEYFVGVAAAGGADDGSKKRKA